MPKQIKLSEIANVHIYHHQPNPNVIVYFKDNTPSFSACVDTLIANQLEMAVYGETSEPCSEAHNACKPIHLSYVYGETGETEVGLIIEYDDFKIESLQTRARVRSRFADIAERAQALLANAQFVLGDIEMCVLDEREDVIEQKRAELSSILSNTF